MNAFDIIIIFLCRNIFILIRFIVTTKPSLRFFQLLKIKRVCAICLYCSEYMVKRMNANNYNWFKSVCNLIKFFIENRRTQYVILLWIVQKQNENNLNHELRCRELRINVVNSIWNSKAENISNFHTVIMIYFTKETKWIEKCSANWKEILICSVWIGWFRMKCHSSKWCVNIVVINIVNWWN